MHYTTVRNPIHLIHKDGEIIHTFSGWDQLIHYWPHIRRLDIGPGPSHKKTYDHDAWLREFFRNEHVAFHHEYILRDSLGNVINPDDVRDAYNKKHPRRRLWWYYPGAKRRGRGHYFRRIRTTQERRWANAWDDEDDAPKSGFARNRRNYHNLPNAWDDIPCSDWSYRNWKNYRRTQWK